MQPVLVATAAGPIELVDIGTGPAVIVVHGMPGDWSQAAALGEELAQDNRVLLVSRPGYGRTPQATGETWRATATAYTALLDELGLATAAIMGISGGGPSSYAFAAHERDRCSGLILACAVHPDVRAVPWLMRTFHATPVLREALTALARRKQVRALADPDALLAAAMAEANDVERARIEHDPIAMAWLLEFVRHHVRVTEDMRPFRHDLRQLVRHQRRGEPLVWPEGPDVATLILHGDDDPVVGLDNAHRFAADIPGADLEVYEGAGHGFLFTFRADATPRLRAFLANVPAR